MRLYAGTSKQFITDSVHNQIAEKLRDAFFNQYRFSASQGEIQSWRNSLRAMEQVLQNAGLDDHGILLEYQLPLTSSTAYWISGLSTIVSISFGVALVAGKVRVPRPVTGKTALRTGFLIPIPAGEISDVALTAEDESVPTINVVAP